MKLRAVRPEDLIIFYEQHRDPAAVRMAITPVREKDAFIARWLKHMADPDILSRTIEVDGAAVGHAVIFPNEGRRWVGYWLDRAVWGRGIATKVVRELLLLDTSRPLFADTADTNVASQLVLLKNGFKEASRKPGTVTWRIS